MKAPRALLCLLLGGFTPTAPAAELSLSSPPAALVAMEQAAQGGLDRFLATARRQNWRAPAIPSQWHVEHVALVADRPAGQSARNLGKSLARHLTEFAPKIHRLPPGDELFRHAVLLCDLAEWDSATEGYGNALLAQRAVDLAAVAAARLTADLNFPLTKVSPLITRLLRTPWAGLSARVRMLNAEAGAVIFPAEDQDDVELIWHSGCRLLAESQRPSLRAERLQNPGLIRIKETPAILAHLAFFADHDPAALRPATLLGTWEHKWHARLIAPLEPRSVRQAWALAEFRRVVGNFPLTLHTVELCSPATSTGSSPLDPPRLVFPADRSLPGEAAFQQAWLHYLTSVAPFDDFPRPAQVPAAAWATFNAVRNGEFLDQDTRNEKFSVKPSASSTSD
jgi:hypothetical protein